MNYIINPSVFYWISVASEVKGVAILMLVLGTAGVFAGSIIYLTNNDLLDDEERAALRTLFRFAAPIFAFGLLGVIFIPDKQTLIEMLIAKTATVDNAEWTLDALKQAVDYIVAAMK
ncbi:MAG: hypothetical protein J6S14_02315 [Clostridia bacterium]|nr:hypothetical protein [Clostridia bacterium]